MSLGKLLGIVCIVLGFVAAIFDVKILFEPLSWFVAAVALAYTVDWTWSR